MALSEKDSRRIQDYLDGSLSAEERLRLEQDCKQDSSLAAALTLYRYVQEELKDKEVAAFRQQVLDSIERHEPTPKGRTNKRKPKAWVLLLLGLFSIIVLAYLLSLNSSNSPAAEETEKPELPLSPSPEEDTENSLSPNIIADESKATNSEKPERSKPSKTDTELIPHKKTKAKRRTAPPYRQLAISEYTATTFVFRGINANKEPSDTVQQALLLFAQANAAKDANEQENYLEQALGILNDNRVAKDQRLLLTRAQAYFQLGQYTQAASDFKALQNSFIYGGDADWGLALCYLAQMPAKADAFQDAMSVMLKDESHSFHAKALQLSKQVEAAEE
jgi:tetratricopeptide (TPR) repeat protein